MKQLKNIFFALALVAVGASAASAQVQFFVSASGARPLRSEGTTEAVGTVAFASNNTGNIVFDSIITLDYGTTVLGAAGATVSTTCRLAGAATLATSVVGSVLTLKVTGTVAADFLACANGNSITVTAARVNASALGSGASVNVAVGASVPAAFQSTNAVTLISVGTLTVGQVQSGLSTATTINPGITTNNFLLCNVSDGDSEDVKVMIEENFPAAFLSAADEAALNNNVAPEAFKIRFAFQGYPCRCETSSKSYLQLDYLRDYDRRSWHADS